MTATNYRFRILVLLLLLCSCYFADAAAKINSAAAPCLPDQASSLLQLKSSFIVANNLSSWQAGTDCCHWEGIICDTGSGRIISLDLSEFELMSLRLHPALFNLTSLRNLNLALNHFTDVRFPASGFERLTDITHLNFSQTYFIGQIPGGISRLKNLVTLDFSDNNGLYLKDPSFGIFMANMSNLRELFLDCVDLSSSGSTWSALLGHSVPQLRILSLPQCGLSGSIHPSFSRLGELTTINFGNNYQLYFQGPSFRTIMANMSNLRELHLDSVDLSSSGSTWSTALADYVPQLQILSLCVCGLSGSIHPSFSRLRSLASIYLADNPGLRGKVPEYFSQLSSLSSLDIASTSFEGQFPTEIFQLKSLKALDLSGNPMLFVRFTYFPAGNNLRNLNLAGTNFTYDTPLSLANLTSLQTLSLTTATMAKQLPTSIRLPSLNRLELEGSGLEKPVLYWVGNLKELKYLRLDGYDFSHSTLSWINNLTKLETLYIQTCSASVPILSHIGSLAYLTDLELSITCYASAQQMPSVIGNLTKLTSLSIAGFNFSGPIPYQIGNLASLTNLVIEGCDFSGYQIPSSIGNLTKLVTLDISDNHYLSGPIPSTIGNLIQIERLRLSSNNLTGETLNLNCFLPILLRLYCRYVSDTYITCPTDGQEAKKGRVIRGRLDLYRLL